MKPILIKCIHLPELGTESFTTVTHCFKMYFDSVNSKRIRSFRNRGALCYGFQFPVFLHLSITSALSRVLAQCILPSSMLHLRCDCLSPVLYQRSLPSLYLLHSPCRLCEVLPLYVCMSERFSFYSVYLLSLTHAELTLSICLQPVLRPPARSGF